MARICILKPDPNYEENWWREGEVIEQLFGAEVEFRFWKDQKRLLGHDLILPLFAWGYQRDPVHWFTTLDWWNMKKLPVWNPVTLLRWNTDKGYLFDLEAAGLPIVPTRMAAHLSDADLADARTAFGKGDLVIKPTISGGADGTHLLRTGELAPADVRFREMLIQPMMASITSEGEYSLFYFDGRFSHAVLKKPADGDFRVQSQFGGRDNAVDPPLEALRLGEATLKVLPDLPLYARVDVIRDDAGHFCLMELEVIEPSLFLHAAPDGGAAFAAAVRKRLG